MAEFIQEFTDAQSVIDAYGAPLDALKDAEIHVAWYGYGDYCGDSLVVFDRGGKLWEVNGSHCSCFGLEGQWEPEETSWDALAKRNYSRESGGSCEGSGEAHEALGKIVAAHVTNTPVAGGTT